MGLYHGDVGMIYCHEKIDWYESFPPRACWSFLHGPFVRGAHSERKPVRREFGLVWGHGHVHMNGRACSFVRAGAVRMCIVLVRGLGMGCVLPTGRGVRLRGL